MYCWVEICGSTKRQNLSGGAFSAMGNCLPFIYFNSQGADDEEHLEVLVCGYTMVVGLISEQPTTPECQSREWPLKCFKRRICRSFCGAAYPVTCRKSTSRLFYPIPMRYQQFVCFAEFLCQSTLYKLTWLCWRTWPRGHWRKTESTRQGYRR